MTFEERIEFLFQSIESHDRQIGENASQIADLKDAISKLVRVSNEDATSIQALARIADPHERRISDMERNR
jgi:4-hydroxy-3-methylbut-2-en-1-yl diphosphate synthase IspG/GcpE